MADLTDTIRKLTEALDALVDSGAMAGDSHAFFIFPVTPAQFDALPGAEDDFADDHALADSGLRLKDVYARGQFAVVAQTRE